MTKAHSIKELETFGQFIADNSIANNGIDPQLSEQIRSLADSYKKNTIESGDVIICVETGFQYGNITSRLIHEIHNPKPLKYDPNNYDNLSIVSNGKRIILWTDFSDTEPYNRQSHFYVPHSFSDMLLTKTEKNYREFILEREGKRNISFAINGFRYNSVWKHVEFGICVKKDDAEIFISKLRNLLNK